MPPQTLFDISAVDTQKIVITRDEIYQVNPHRYEFALLHGFCHVNWDAMEMAAVMDLTQEDFWVRGHIPGRPLLPGVLMIEAAAQMVSYFTKVHAKEPNFVGFGAVDDVKFRGQVVPGDRMLLLGKMTELRPHRRAVAQTQGFVDGKMVFEGTITGVMM